MRTSSSASPSSPRAWPRATIDSARTEPYSSRVSRPLTLICAGYGRKTIRVCAFASPLTSFSAPSVSPLTLGLAYTGTKINDTNKAAVGTPLACTIVDHPDKTFDLYLYFVDGTKALTRMVYSGNSDNGTWGSALTIGKAKVDASSGLTVVADRKENLNRVYFITKGDLKYTVLSDPFKGSEKGVSE